MTSSAAQVKEVSGAPLGASYWKLWTASGLSNLADGVFKIALPLLATLFIWWFSTGLILYLDGLPRSTYKWSMLWATVLAAVAFAGDDGELAALQVLVQLGHHDPAPAGEDVGGAHANGTGP